MKAAVFHGLDEPLQIQNVAEPVPSADEVVIRVARCGICGSDLHATHDAAFNTQPGTILGHEFAGEVVAVGRSVSSLIAGDLVSAAPLNGCGRCPACLAGEPAWCEHFRLQGGGYAEFVAAAERQCLKLPATTSLADGALVEPLAVSLHGVMRGGVKPGARVLIIGAGPIGLGVAFWSRRLGAARIAVCDLSTQQRELAHRMGATDYIEAGPECAARTERALGAAPDIVFECVGRPGIIGQAVDQVARRGKVVVLGLCTLPDTFIPFSAVSKEVDLITSAFFTMHEYQTALDMLDGGKAPPTAMVTDTVSLSAMPPVFEALRRRSSQCKVMVAP